MDNVKCCAIKRDGTQCESRRKNDHGDGTRCKMHYTLMVAQGRCHTIIKEMKLQTQHECNTLTDPLRVRQLRAELTLRIVRFIADNNDEYYAEADERRNTARANAERRQEYRNVVRQQYEYLHVPQPQGDELINFVRNQQNVHTSHTVKQNTEVIEKLKTIPVSSGYRWNLTSCSKTPFEVGLECNLTPDATMNMVTYYCGKSQLGTPADTKQYGQVLDGMWQFVKNSPHKEDLCKIIKSELQDSIGMCPMGNVSRVCNVLAGYMDGVTQTESLNEKLGNLFSPLMNITDVNERMRQATKILRENNVSRVHWKTWTDPLME